MEWGLVTAKFIEWWLNPPHVWQGSRTATSRTASSWLNECELISQENPKDCAAERRADSAARCPYQMTTRCDWDMIGRDNPLKKWKILARYEVNNITLCFGAAGWSRCRSR